MDPFASYIENLLGPFLVFMNVGFILYGTFMAQVYAYWFAYNDSRHLKGLVVSLCVLESIHSALSMHAIYQYYVIDIGNPLNIAYIVWSAETTTYLKVFVVLLAQGFSIYRIWQLSGKNHLTTAIPAVLLLGSTASGLASVSLCVRGGSTWIGCATSRDSKAALTATMVLWAAMDLSITGFLTYYLHKHKSSFRRTQYLIQRLTFYTINTGALTSACAVTTLFTFNFVPNSLIYAGMLEIMSKLYANAMLAMLNARKSIKEEYVNDNGLISIPLAIRGSGSDGTARRRAGVAPGSVRVDIFKETSTENPSSSGGTVNDASVALQKEAYPIV